MRVRVNAKDRTLFGFHSHSHSHSSLAAEGGRELGPRGGHERLRRRVVLVAVSSPSASGSGVATYSLYSTGTEFSCFGELPPRVVRRDPGAVGAPRPPNADAVGLRRRLLLEVGDVDRRESRRRAARASPCFGPRRRLVAAARVAHVGGVRRDRSGDAADDRDDAECAAGDRLIAPAVAVLRSLVGISVGTSVGCQSSKRTSSACRRSVVRLVGLEDGPPLRDRAVNERRTRSARRTTSVGFQHGVPRADPQPVPGERSFTHRFGRSRARGG